MGMSVGLRALIPSLSGGKPFEIIGLLLVHIPLES
jgi:hypothetical protein